MIPQGIRQNNPLNIRYDGTHWQGLADPPQQNGFCAFSDALYGLRAAMINLKHYQDNDGIWTLREVIYRHAPNNENPTMKYLQYVSQRIATAPDVSLDLHARQIVIPLVRAMAEFENGPLAVTYISQIYDHAADLADLN